MTIEKYTYRDFASHSQSPDWKSQVRMTVDDTLTNETSIAAAGAWAGLLSLAGHGSLRAEVDSTYVAEFLEQASSEAYLVPEKELRTIATNVIHLEASGRYHQLSLAIAGGEAYILSLGYASDELHTLGYNADQILTFLRRSTAQLLEVRNRKPATQYL